MGVKVYDSTSQAFVDATPKVQSGGVWADTEGKVYSGNQWADAWKKDEGVPTFNLSLTDSTSVSKLRKVSGTDVSISSDGMGFTTRNLTAYYMLDMGKTITYNEEFEIDLTVTEGTYSGNVYLYFTDTDNLNRQSPSAWFWLSVVSAWGSDNSMGIALYETNSESYRTELLIIGRNSGTRSVIFKKSSDNSYNLSYTPSYNYIWNNTGDKLGRLVQQSSFDRIGIYLNSLDSSTGFAKLKDLYFGPIK